MPELRPNWTPPLLFVTALVCGALIMVVEVLGSRVIGPFFGVSLFIWTALIAVTLVALAMGYAIGGQLADRRGTLGVLYGIIFLAGVAVLLIPYYKLVVLKLCVPLGLRLGAVVSASLLFGPSLLLMGCVSPLLVKIAASEMKSLGRTVGRLYAVSTVGSVIGTILTGFVLVAHLGVNSIFQLVGGMLCALSLAYFLVLRRYWKAAPLLLVALLVPPSQSGALPSVLQDNGTRASLVAFHDGYYGSLKIIDYTYRDRHVREMVVDGAIQGGVDMASGQSFYPYPYFLTMLPFSLKPDIKHALVVGLGAGIMPRWLEQNGVRTDVVDIDPAIFDFAERYFDFRITGRKHIQDARYFLQTTEDRYDLVLLDVFNGDITPSHVLSLEALQLVGERMSPNGMLAINLIGDLHDNSYMTASVVKTLGHVFDQVHVYLTEHPDESRGATNLTLVAYQGAERSPDTSYWSTDDISQFARQQVLENIGKRFEFPAGTKATILTDNYNPVDVFDIQVREIMRRRILQSLNWDILGYSG